MIRGVSEQFGVKVGSYSIPQGRCLGLGEEPVHEEVMLKSKKP